MLPQNGYCQSLDDLNSQREEAQREIKRLDRELSEIESSTKTAQKELTLSTERLQSRLQVLNSIEKQISLLNISQRKQSSQAKEYIEQMASMKNAYKKTSERLYSLRQCYSGSEILLSDSLQSLEIHLINMSQYLLSEITKRSEEILKMQGVVGAELRDISLRGDKLDVLHTDAKAAVEEIQSDKKRIEALTKELGGKTQELSAQREAWLKAIAQLQERIAEAIALELAANSSESSEEFLEISSKDFEKFKGKMVSPLANSRIIDTYGVHNHPTQAGVKIDNKGINLEGKAQSSIRVVASGEVRKVFMVAGMGASILVRHGQYITVYSNLTTVGVKVGDNVSTGSVLGQVGSDGMLHFEIWNETTNENPTKWIKF